jgi:hypothetical protein
MALSNTQLVRCFITNIIALHVYVLSAVLVNAEVKLAHLVRKNMLQKLRHLSANAAADVVNLGPALVIQQTFVLMKLYGAMVIPLTNE